MLLWRVAPALCCPDDGREKPTQCAVPERLGKNRPFQRLILNQTGKHPEQENLHERWTILQPAAAPERIVPIIFKRRLKWLPDPENTFLHMQIKSYSSSWGEQDYLDQMMTQSIK